MKKSFSINLGGGFLALLFFIFIPFFSFAEENQALDQTTIQDQTQQKVYRLNRIEIKGLEFVDPEIIKPLIPFGKGAIVTRDKLAQTLRELYKLGYFRDIEAYTRYTENGVDLIFVFEELPVVQKIEFEGNEEISEEDLLQALGIQTQQRMESGGIIPITSIGPELAEKLASIKKGLGRVFSIEEIKRMEKIIQKKYEKEGFYNVKVSFYFKGNTLVFKIDEGQRAYVDKIIIEGNKQIPKDEILDVMETKERNPWKLRFRPRLEKEVLYDDIDKIRQLYLDKGFFEVDVSEPIIQLKDGERYIIKIKIKEGPRYKLSDLVFKNNNYYTDDEILERFKKDLKIGDYYDGEIIKRIKKELLDKYSELGFIFASAPVNRILDKENKTVKVVYDIQPGEIFYVDEIDITGNYESRDYVIRRELRFSPGDLLQRKKLFRSQSRLYRLGFYNAVGFEPKVKEEGQLDIDVKVSERFTGQISFGAGYSQLTGFSLFASIKKANFMGTGDTVGLSLSVGSDYRNNSISYIHRWAFYKPVDLSFDLYDRYVDYTTFVSEKKGFSPSISYEISEYWRTGFGVAFQAGKFKDIDNDAPIRIQEQAGSYSIFSVFWNFNRNSVDNPILPTTGSDFNIGVKVGIGNRGYYKFYTSYAFFLPDKIFYTDWIFSAKARYGAIKAMHDKILLDELFFVGGDFSIRGFDYGMGGPYDENKKEPLGSKQQLVFNFQLSHPIAEKFLWGYGFVDLGKGYNSGNPFRHMYYSVGLGLKLVTPMAPIDIYYGKVLNAPDGVSDSRFGFVLGTFF